MAQGELPEDEAALEGPPMEEPDLAGNNAAPMARPRRPRCGCRRGWPWGHAVLARQEGLVMGFVAYDCTNATNRMEPAACPTTDDHYERPPRDGEDHLWGDCPDEERPNRARVPLHSDRI